jgi:hypothetical protein
VALLTLLAVLAASSCGGSSAQTDVVAPAPSSTASSDVAGAIATPDMLPVTPVSIDYEVVDPAFEPLAGASALFGEHDGTGYRIEVPANWNGEVVYYAHGFRGNPPALTVSFPPLREHLIANGYAWAASSYSKNGYEPGAGARDMRCATSSPKKLAPRCGATSTANRWVDTSCRFRSSSTGRPMTAR